jgi:ubiquinone/menaquinone biosynthesis C-methylase UbiE
MRIPLTTRLALALVVATGLAASPAAQNKDIRTEAARLLKELNVGPDGSIADLGAGGGEMTVELSRQMGPNGRVYSTDINPKTVEGLRALVAKEGLTNVVVRDGHEERTNLPDACCDGVFVRLVYHHFADPAKMNASIRKALKPGGRFGVIDFGPKTPQPGGVPPGKRNEGDTHGVTSDEVVSELQAAGFVDIQTSTEWPYPPSFFVRATRPRSADGSGHGTGRW